MALFVRGSQRAWWLIRITPDESRVALPMDRMLAIGAERMGIAPMGDLGFAIAALVLVGLVGGYFVCACGQLLRIDRDRLSRRALLDVATDARFLAAVLVAPLALIALAYWPGWIDLAIFPILAWVLVSPLLVWSRPALEGTGGLGAIDFNWPGLAAVGACLALWIGSWLFDRLVDSADQLGLGASMLAQLVSIPVAAALGLLICASWVDRLQIAELWAGRSELLSWPAVAAFIALELRILVVGLWLAAPILFALISKIWVLPQIDELMQEHGERMPRLFWIVANLSEYWWIPIFLLFPAALRVSGRLYVMTFPERGKGDGGN